MGLMTYIIKNYDLKKYILEKNYFKIKSIFLLNYFEKKYGWN